MSALPHVVVCPRRSPPLAAPPLAAPPRPRLRQRPWAALALLATVLGAAPPAAWAQKARPGPVLTAVEATAEGYALLGRGFGRDPSVVAVLEGETELAATALVSVVDGRIAVRSKARGTVRHTVVVAGQTSEALAFTHSGAPADRPPLAVGSVTVDPVDVEGGEPVTATIEMTAPAPRGGAVVWLTRTGGPGLILPPQVIVPEGQTHASLKLATEAVPVAVTLQVAASHSPMARRGPPEDAPAPTAALTLRPVSITVSRLDLEPATVQGGAPSAATVTLSRPAPAGGADIALTSSSAAAILPATMTIPPGSDRGQVAIQTWPVEVALTAVITAQGTTGATTALLAIRPDAAVAQTQAASATAVLVDAAAGEPAQMSLPDALQPTTGQPDGQQAAAGEPAQMSQASGPLLTVAQPGPGPQSPDGQAEMAQPDGPLATLFPDIRAIHAGPGAALFVKSFISVEFRGLTPEREARITRIRGVSSSCRFTKAEAVTVPIAVPSAADGQSGSAVAVPGTFISTWPGVNDRECLFEIGFEWRHDGGAAWEQGASTRSLTIVGHEAVTVTDTEILQDWFRPFSAVGLGPCSAGLGTHDGKLAFEVAATPLGADCAYEVMSTRNRVRLVEENFNLLPEGVVLSSMTWNVETHGSGCCLGTSMNECCAALPGPPATYSFDTIAGMDPTGSSGSLYSVFTDDQEMMTEDQIIVGFNPEGRYRTAILPIYGRLSCPAVPLLTEAEVVVGGALCDAGCAALSEFGLAALVPSGTGIEGGVTLKYTDEWQGQCSVDGGFLDGQCQAVTSCPPLHEKFSDNGVWKCRTTALSATDMPWIRVTLASMEVMRPPGTQLPW